MVTFVEIGPIGLLTHTAGALVVGLGLGIYVGIRLAASALARNAVKRGMGTLLHHMLEPQEVYEERLAKALRRL